MTRQEAETYASTFFSERAQEVLVPIFMKGEEDDFEFGPGHIVFSDGNLGDGSIDWCIESARAGGFEHMGSRHEWGQRACEVTLEALLALREIPERERELHEDFEDEDDDQGDPASLTQK